MIRVMDKREAAETAIRYLGGYRPAARILNVSAPVVHRWVNVTGQIPAHHVLAVEAACESRVTRYQLRPDVFGAGA